MNKNQFFMNFFTCLFTLHWLKALGFINIALQNAIQFVFCSFIGININKLKYFLKLILEL